MQKNISSNRKYLNFFSSSLFFSFEKWQCGASHSRPNSASGLQGRTGRTGPATAQLANPSDRGRASARSPLDPSLLDPHATHARAPAAAMAPPPRSISRLLCPSLRRAASSPPTRPSPSLPCAPSPLYLLLQATAPMATTRQPALPFLPWPLSPLRPSSPLYVLLRPPAPWSPPTRSAEFIPPSLCSFSFGPFLPSVTSLWRGN